MIIISVIIAAIGHKVSCANINKAPHINDVYYEYIANDDCDTVFVSSSDSIFPTAATSIDFESNSLTRGIETKFAKDLDSTSLRKPRSEKTDDIKPTSALKFEENPATSTATAEERQNNPNADIQDIITGIVKLLNGNVNVHANTQYIPATSVRRFATRINNRGPPRISDYPLIVPIDEKYGNMKTTSYPSGVRKPPMIPYPFDMLPPDKPLRNEHTILVHNNKPVQPNRLPWHGSRTRPPIQIPNTNRMQMPTRLPHQPSLDFRPSSKSVNPMIAFSTRTPETNQSREIYPSESQPIELFEQIKSSNPNEQISEETSKDIDPTKIMTKFSTSTLPPQVDSSNDVPELHTEIQSTSVLPTAILDEVVITTIDTSSTSVPYSSVAIAETTESLQTFSTSRSTENPTINESVSLSTAHSTISPSRVENPSQPIKSTNFKSFYARPGIVLDDTDYTPGVLEPSTQYHHFHRNTDIQSTASISDIFAEIFDVTLSAIQGQPNSHHKVVDLLEIANTHREANSELMATKYGANDIIVSASDDNSFVSIDGKRTYINLFGETAETEHLKNPSKSPNDHSHHQGTTKTVRIYIYCRFFL